MESLIAVVLALSSVPVVGGLAFIGRTMLRMDVREIHYAGGGQWVAAGTVGLRAVEWRRYARDTSNYALWDGNGWCTPGGPVSARTQARLNKALLGYVAFHPDYREVDGAATDARTEARRKRRRVHSLLDAMGQRGSPGFSAYDLLATEMEGCLQAGEESRWSR